jgi:peroxiredoxin
MARGLKLAGVTFFLIAFAWLTYQVKQSGPPQQGEVQELGPVSVGQPAPDFTLQDLKGETVSLASYRGDVVVLDFWMARIPSCLFLLPVLESLARQYRDQGVVILCLSQRETRDEVMKALRRSYPSLQMLLDREGKVGRAYDVTTLPTLVLLDRLGDVAWINVGFKRQVRRQLGEQVAKLARAPQGEW